MAALPLVASPAAAEEASQQSETSTTTTSDGATRLPGTPLTITYGAPPSAGEEPGSTSSTVGAASARVGSPAPPAAALSTAPTPEFSFEFGASVTESQRDVFRAAARIWGDVLQIRVPVVIAVESGELPPGALGGAAPLSFWVGDPRFPRADSAYPVALANQHSGVDFDPGLPDIDVLISSEIDFYEGLDTSVPGDKYSLLQLALHELGHGLGHTTGAYEEPPGSGTIKVVQGPYSLPYDRFVANAAGKTITSMSTSELQTAVKRPLYWVGPEGKRRSSTAISLYAPDPFEWGSSIGHSNDPNQLMFPFIFTGDATTKIPSLAVGMMSDIGWPLPAAGGQAYAVAIARDFLDRHATPTERRSVESKLKAGTNRLDIVKSYAYSDEWVGTLIDGYYQSTLGRGPDASGRAYWIGVIKSGTTPAEVAAYFYASPEYFSRSGGTNRKWVGDLYRQILHRNPDSSGLNYWTGLADRGVGRDVIALDFFQSIESRRDRVRRLYRDLLGRNPDTSGHAYWADVLKNGRDVELAIFLAGSQEYYNRSQKRFL